MNIDFLRVLSWVLRGKTITRAYMNTMIAMLPKLDGLTIDLGGGGSSTYKTLLKIEKETYVNMDAMAEAQPTIIGDLEKTHSFGSNSADTILLFNKLEHVYNYELVASEIYRVLKIDCSAYIYSPFLLPVHTHPTEDFFIDDFFRYSRSALFKIFENAGFSKLLIMPCGGLLVVIGEYIGFVVRVSILSTIVALTYFILESFYLLLKGDESRVRYPLAYFVSVHK